MNMCQRLQKEIHRFILYNGQDNEETNNSKDLKNTIIKSILEQDGSPTLRSHRETCRGIQNVRPRQISGTARRLEVEQKLEFLEVLI